MSPDQVSRNNSGPPRSVPPQWVKNPAGSRQPSRFIAARTAVLFPVPIPPLTTTFMAPQAAPAGGGAGLFFLARSASDTKPSSG